MGRKKEGKAEKMFKRLGKKVDLLLEDLQEAKEQAYEEYGDRFDEIKKNGATIKEELSQFKEKHQDKFDGMESNIEQVGRDIKKTVDKVFKKDKKEKK